MWDNRMIDRTRRGECAGHSPQDLPSRPSPPPLILPLPFRFDGRLEAPQRGQHGSQNHAGPDSYLHKKISCADFVRVSVSVCASNQAIATYFTTSCALYSSAPPENQSFVPHSKQQQRIFLFHSPLLLPFFPPRKTSHQSV